MNEELLKTLANKELKQAILNEAKKILSKRIINKKENKIKEKEEKDKEKEKEEKDKEKEKEEKEEKEKEEKEKNILLYGKNASQLSLEENIILIEKKKEESFVKKSHDLYNSFFHLQDFSRKYTETCKMFDPGYGDVEYDLLLSFINTFNNEMNYQFHSINMNKPNEQEKDLMNKMIKVFIEKLLFYCTTPIIVFSKPGLDTKGLFDPGIAMHISNFFNIVEQYNDSEDICKNCIGKILISIFKYNPNPNEMISWIARQAFVDLAKIFFGNSPKRAELCIEENKEI